MIRSAKGYKGHLTASKPFVKKKKIGQMHKSTETSLIKKLKNQVVCPVEFTLRILGGKWRGSILYQLKDGGLRFNELKKRVQDAVIDYEDADNYLTNKVLSWHLKELISYQLVHKKNDASQNTLYELTAVGISLIPILIDLFYWGEYLMKLPNGNLNYENEDLSL